MNESYPAVADSVPRARRALADFARSHGATDEQLDGIRLVASEALSNAVLHAYRGAPGEVHVTAAVAAGELWILIADDGGGLRARNDRPGLGLGLAWMAQFSDGLTLVTRASGGLEVRVRFELMPATEAPKAQERGSLASASRPASSRFSTTR